MAVKCAICGNEIESGSRFCSACGAPLKTAGARKGGNVIRVAFVFAGVIPAVVILIQLVLAVLTGKFPSYLWFNISVVTIALILFDLVYSGHEWAIKVLGLGLVIVSLVDLAIIFTILTLSAIIVVNAISRILWIWFGFYLFGSTDVLAFVQDRKARLAHAA